MKIRIQGSEDVMKIKIQNRASACICETLFPGAQEATR